jgi:thymidylate kinase
MYLPYSSRGMRMEKQSRLICFIGIDGSGKTTLSKNIVNNLVKKNYNCVYNYGRVKPVISRMLMAIGRTFFLRRPKSAIYTDYTNYTREKKEKLQNVFYKKLFISSLLIDQIIQLNYIIRLKKLSGTTIISDRYLHDTIITDIGSNLNYSADEVVSLIQFGLRFVPKPDLVFYVDIDEETAFSRKNDVPDVEYLRERRDLYKNCSRILKLNVIDGSKSPETLCAEVSTSLQSTMGNSNE